MSDSPESNAKRVNKVLENLREKLHAQAAAEMGLENQDEIPPEQLQLLMDSLTENLKHANSPGISIHWAVLLASFIILFSFVGFFGYRLVRSLTERERKKEEKKKLKELKKKK